MKSSLFPRLVALAACLGLSVTVVSAQTMAPEPGAPSPRLAEPERERDGLVYPVSEIGFEYPFDHPALPDTTVLDGVVVLLSPVEGGWIGPVADADVVPVRIGDIGGGGVELIYGTALAAINQGVRDFMEREYGLIGHLVTPDAEEIAYRTTRRDLRPAGDTELTIMIWRAAVGEVRTVAHGRRLARSVDGEGDAEPVSNVNRVEHARIRDRLRVGEGDLLTRADVDDEIYRLNRHPGRRVDAAIAPGGERGEVIVDYLVTEPRPWSAYVSVSNTGTESTDEWQQRFGFIHRQLTGRDDVLRLDYVTTWFDETNAFLGSYEFDMGPKARFKVYGRWSEYTARDLGFGFENFVGESYAAGAELAVNVWQDGPKFIDLVGGARYEHIHVENRLFGIEGTEDFLLPYVGVRYEKKTPLHNAFGELLLETNLPSVVGTSEAEINGLGRFEAEEEFTLLRGQLSHSFFLEPIFDPAGFRGDRGQEGMTLAHELALNVRGQYSFNGRLVPNFQSVTGGFHTVRGYPESAAVGDDSIMGSVEYRFHLGRSLPVSTETTTLLGQPFRTTRTRPYGGADWDLIFKGFLDAARVSPNDAPFFEEAETLVGIGVGIEAQLKQHVTLRLDYGMALSPVGEGAARTTEVGDTQLHFMAQFVF